MKKEQLIIYINKHPGANVDNYPETSVVGWLCSVAIDYTEQNKILDQKGNNSYSWIASCCGQLFQKDSNI